MDTFSITNYCVIHQMHQKQITSKGANPTIKCDMSNFSGRQQDNNPLNRFRRLFFKSPFFDAKYDVDLEIQLSNTIQVIPIRMRVILNISQIRGQYIKKSTSFKIDNQYLELVRNFSFMIIQLNFALR
ncbi:unnamed protein product (macronuclear) [Paramecium tetraurelia]|uniref:C2 NT-type domain-containing protein n=1 Tax=Paramecium tetraurelia TaxID=5888 RepID=A0D5S2_PARTE|nr:uncharacterized protein GSPATT00013819001 [Paramecium tetraurelia]CAK78389.1 unnamed protein product [Paramecium tetraurelia]|eukprot:XP_001445786.1 hypothetical protein (macronuclear) [Paramecium tetraurelia strain d4-2]